MSRVPDIFPSAKFPIDRKYFVFFLIFSGKRKGKSGGKLFHKNGPYTPSRTAHTWLRTSHERLNFVWNSFFSRKADKINALRGVQPYLITPVRWNRGDVDQIIHSPASDNPTDTP